MKNKQKGMASIVGLIIAAGAVLLFMREFSYILTQKNIRDNSESFYNRLVFLNTQFHAFANDRYLAGQGINTPHIFPFELQRLEGDYIPVCSDADNKEGYCFKYNQMPWGDIEKDDYQVVPVGNPGAPTHYRAEITIKLPDKNNTLLVSDREATLRMLAKMPNLFYDKPNNTLIMHIERPDKAFSYESLIKRSGDDSSLLGDWDVGGKHAITNVRDVTIANSDGTQRLVSTGLVHVLEVKTGDRIFKPSCPQGLKPKIRLNVASTFITSLETQTGSFKAFVDNETNQYWEIKLEIRGKDNDTGNSKIINDGTVTAFVQCANEKDGK
ncbi:type II secretion system protein [Aliivibrio salmonicida]|uniref:type II secretion system protein n=1 Tax=Aliivibrio salmonicida TaxID=40269 RepID=UPI00406C21BF